MFKLVSTTMLVLSLATVAMAESAKMARPIQAGSLHAGPMDMVAYWVPLEDEGYELTATFVGRTAGDQPMRIVMRLDEGDDVAFSMPGHGTALYRFVRKDDIVDASVSPVGNVVAAN